MKILKILSLVLILNLHLTASELFLKKNSFQILCYHNVVDKIVDTKIMSITTDQLIEQFKWLKANGYNIINIDDILKAKNGEKDLPQKAVLLTFDDGYKSFYTRIYPLLKLFDFPAVYALVGRWMQTPLGEDILYGNTLRPRELLLDWDEVNEMIRSGLVEIASHSYDSHHGIIANPQGNLQPALTTLKFDPKTRRYERVDEYIKRVDFDIKKSSDVIYKYTGYRARAIAWPYGAYNAIVQKIARKYGMNLTLTLDDGVNTPKDIAALKRILIGNASGFKTFYWSMKEPGFAPNRSLFIDIDDIYDKDAKKANEKLGKVIEKIAKLKISTVVLKAYSDVDNDGFADSLYFPNSVLPMKADLLNRVAWQLKSRAKIDGVYVRMPLSAFEFHDKKFSVTNNKADIKKIKQIYFDMAKQSFFEGVLFDITQKTDYTDAKTLIKTADILKKKMRYFTKEITLGVLMDMKRVFSLNKNDLKKILTTFDHTFIDMKTMPKDKRASKKRLLELIKKVRIFTGALQKCDFVFNENRGDFLYQSKLLLVNKAVNLSYKPGNFVKESDGAKLAALIDLLSLKDSPFE